jgi:hypothetical protein
LHWWLGKFVRLRKIPHQPHFALGGLASATRGVVGDAPHAALAASRGSPTRPTNSRAPAPFAQSSGVPLLYGSQHLQGHNLAISKP